eukprot:TRINITY_DN24224_c0_g1_i1.p1 TRINITY_DN24224_c0_g1~~TRINITY_DN24224_c0_g1_i1.p1  ORF type:complete len:165 (+),score=4.76 TRINITY_DN24224_c0_g1_i1:13-507(+)
MHDKNCHIEFSASPIINRKQIKKKNQIVLLSCSLKEKNKKKKKLGFEHLLLLVLCYLIIIGKESHESPSRALVRRHEAAHHSNQTASDHRWTSDFRFYPREISDGDGDTGYGDESKVVGDVEVGDRFIERRVAIDYWVLGLRRRGDVRVHLRRYGHSLLPSSSI